MTGPDELLTLEPFLDAVSEGVTACGWACSGIQKTTSHHFEGRWEGETTRSAYLFFHPVGSGDPCPSDAARAGVPAPVLDWGEDVAVDVFLDETARGLAGNVALVVDLPELRKVLEHSGDAETLLRELEEVASQHLPDDVPTPLTLRVALRDTGLAPGSAEVQARFKVRIPRRVITRGATAVRALAGAAVRGFHNVLADAGLRRLGGVGAG